MAKKKNNIIQLYPVKNSEIRVKLVVKGRCPECNGQLVEYECSECFFDASGIGKEGHEEKA
jgi:uncharacterized protein with PIN domain